MHEIETADGDHRAARAAWQQARDAYLTYRQQGGYASVGGGSYVDHVLDLMSQQKADEVQALFNQIAEDPNTPDSFKKLMQAVITILNGSRDQALADDYALDYSDAAEVLFLIERLNKLDHSANQTPPL